MMKNINASRTGAGLLLRGPLPRSNPQFIAHVGFCRASGVWLMTAMSREHFAT
jgi:hypothetical protein